MSLQAIRAEGTVLSIDALEYLRKTRPWSFRRRSIRHVEVGIDIVERLSDPQITAEVARVVECTLTSTASVGDDAIGIRKRGHGRRPGSVVPVLIG